MQIGQTPEGSPVDAVEITGGPARARVITYGAALTAFHVDGVPWSLLLGNDAPEPYFGPMRHFGAIVGPVANRIAKGRAQLGDRVLSLAVNENGTALHGGPRGASRRVWEITETGDSHVAMRVTFADGEDGLPGPLTLTVRYSLEADGALRIDLGGESPVTTLCNPAFHGYWSLTGEGLGGHRLTVAADHVLSVDQGLIPTGEVMPVTGTPYDLRGPTALPASVGLDTNFCLNGSGMRQVAALTTDSLALEIETDAPGLQVYDAARLSTAPAAGHHGAPYGAHAGVALEPQIWPDAPNHPHFPQITLRPGTPFRQVSRFRVRRVPG